MHSLTSMFFFFFFNDTATTEIYTLSLHDALPIFVSKATGVSLAKLAAAVMAGHTLDELGVPDDLPLPGVAVKEAVFPFTKLDRKSTRLNSSHSQISYAVFCLKKKNIHTYTSTATF